MIQPGRTERFVPEEAGLRARNPIQKLCIRRCNRVVATELRARRNASESPERFGEAGLHTTGWAEAFGPIQWNGSGGFNRGYGMDDETRL